LLHYPFVAIPIIQPSRTNSRTNFPLIAKFCLKIYSCPIDICMHTITRMIIFLIISSDSCIIFSTSIDLDHYLADDIFSESHLELINPSSVVTKLFQGNSIFEFYQVILAINQTYARVYLVFLFRHQ
jgi:hypothetical protein